MRRGRKYIVAFSSSFAEQLFRRNIKNNNRQFKKLEYAL
jgi:hypothetical protein